MPKLSKIACTLAESTILSLYNSKLKLKKKTKKPGGIFSTFDEEKNKLIVVKTERELTQARIILEVVLWCYMYLHPLAVHILLKKRQYKY